MTTKIKIQNYIDGQLVDPQSGQWLDNFEPATGIAYSQVPDSGTADVDAAVAAAKKAFRGWSKTSADRRSIIMNRIADLIERDLDQLIETESIDNGKPEWLARAVDIPPRCKKPPALRIDRHQFRFRITRDARRDQLYASPTHRCRRHYLAMEPSPVLADLENRAGTGDWQLCRRQAL